jgi:guanine deaminase
MSHHDLDQRFMSLAIDKARQAIADLQAPFAAAIVIDGELAALECNRVHETSDPTAHSEILAIRNACTERQVDSLPGATIYCTCEPSPLGFCAIMEAGIERVVFGATIGDAALHGFQQIPVFAAQLKALARSKVEIEPEYRRDECIALFDEFAAVSTDERDA